jgi:hypothetical protein
MDWNRPRRGWRAAFASWFYFGLLRRLLGWWPWPAWHAPAVALAIVRMPFDGEARVLSRALIGGLRIPPPRGRFVRLWWSLTYSREVKTLLYVLAPRLTPGWAARHVRCHGAIPADGAILACAHAAATNAGILHLATRVGPLCSMTLWRSADDLAHLSRIQRQTYLAGQQFARRAYGENLFHVSHAGRRALHVLRRGGYLVTTMDGVSPSAPETTLFGRAIRLPRGPVWFAQQSGKPLLPFVVTARRGTLHLWIGDPAPPTPDGHARALEECIRRAPGGWDRPVIHMWLASPPAREETGT